MSVLIYAAVLGWMQISFYMLFLAAAVVVGAYLGKHVPRMLASWQVMELAFRPSPDVMVSSCVQRSCVGG
jgi:Fe2+ transport system protein B